MASWQVRNRRRSWSSWQSRMRPLDCTLLVSCWLPSTLSPKECHFDLTCTYLDGDRYSKNRSQILFSVGVAKTFRGTVDKHPTPFGTRQKGHRMDYRKPMKACEAFGSIAFKLWDQDSWAFFGLARNRQSLSKILSLMQHVFLRLLNLP